MTGANKGLGKATVEQLCRVFKGDVYLTCTFDSHYVMVLVHVGLWVIFKSIEANLEFLNFVFHHCFCITVVVSSQLKLVEETGLAGENHRPTLSNWQSVAINATIRTGAPIESKCRASDDYSCVIFCFDIHS